MNLKKLNLTILLVTVLVLVPTIQIVYASPLSTFYLSGGIYPASPSYTVWRENSNYYAKNAYGFQPSWSGSTNASQVIQNCFDALPVGSYSGSYYPEGGKVFLFSGSYDISGTITLHEGQHLIGSGRGNTFLEPVADIDIIKISPTQEWSTMGIRTSIEELSIFDFATPNQASKSAIVFDTSNYEIWFTLIRNVEVMYCYNGIVSNHTSEKRIGALTMQTVHVKMSANYGIYLTNPLDCEFIDVVSDQSLSDADSALKFDCTENSGGLGGNTLTNVRVFNQKNNITQKGIVITGLSTHWFFDMKFTNCVADVSGGDNWYFNNTMLFELTGCWGGGSKNGNGFHLARHRNFRLVNCLARGNALNGFYIDGYGSTFPALNTSDLLIGCDANWNDKSGGGYAGFCLNATRVTLSACSAQENDILKYQDYGIREIGISDENTIIGCETHSNIVSGIITIGSNTHVYHCWNHTEWIA